MELPGRILCVGRPAASTESFPSAAGLVVAKKAFPLRNKQGGFLLSFAKLHEFVTRENGS